MHRDTPPHVVTAANHIAANLAPFAKDTAAAAQMAAKVEHRQAQLLQIVRS